MTMTIRHVLGLVMAAMGLGLVAPGCEDEPCKDDHNACTIDCIAGKAAHEPMTDGASCALSGKAGSCAKGACVRACVTDAACDDADPCTADACSGGICSNTYANGTYFGADDLDDCTKPYCFAGEPKQAVVPDGTACGSAGGTCQHGVCSGCEVAADCGTSTICQFWFCEGGACLSVQPVAGTPAPDTIVWLVLDVQGRGKHGDMHADPRGLQRPHRLHRDEQGV